MQPVNVTRVIANAHAGSCFMNRPDLKNNTHYIPIGLGVGKAWKAGSNILNAFVEPQWTVERKGDDLPQFTLFAGINVTFGK